MKAEIPESMQVELGAWNNGKGIDLRSWTGCQGNFSLAVGYAAIFWPKFIEFEDYILIDKFSVEAVRGFEAQKGSTPMSVEWGHKPSSHRGHSALWLSGHFARQIDFYWQCLERNLRGQTKIRISEQAVHC